MLNVFGAMDWVTPTRAFFGWLFLGRQTVVIEELPYGYSAAMIRRGLMAHGVKTYYCNITGDAFVFSVSRKDFKNIYHTIDAVYADGPELYAQPFLDMLKQLFWVCAFLGVVAFVFSLGFHWQCNGNSMVIRI